MLQKMLGGKWKYNRRSRTWEDDSGRTVHSVSCGVDEFDNPIPGPDHACLTSKNVSHFFYWYQLEFEGGINDDRACNTSAKKEAND